MSIFSECGISTELQETISKLGFTEPTQIQKKSVPHIMKGHDVIGESATGSGKTLAFGCGVLEHTNPGEGIQSLILSPTRELAEQIRVSLEQLSHKKHKIISVYGGVGIEPQIHKLQSADIVVGTPGRMLDHMSRDTIDLSKVKVMVLDEADRMFDMGFVEDVEKIMSQIPKERQTLFFSATMSTSVRSLAMRHMKQPIEIAAVKMVDPAKLKQEYYNVQRNMKLSLLIHLLQKEESNLVMVFCNSRRSTDFVTKNLQSNGIKAIAIHGGLTQNKRNKTLELFNNAKTEVLVCTDVAARGLHIDNVSHVYNYEVPNDSTDYVHRIGRTARAGEDGKVINLLADFDHENYQRLLDTYRDFNIVHVETPQLKRVFAKKVEDNPQGGRRFSRGPPRGRSNNQGNNRRPKRRFNRPRRD